MQQKTFARLRLIRIVLSIAMIMGLVITYKLWLTGGRMFPHTPILPFLPQLPYPVDIILFGAVIVILLLIAYGYIARKLIAIFCILFAILMLFDQNRWQPWAYQYFWMMFVLAFVNWSDPNPIRQKNTINALRLIICGIYLYSGLQKLNPKFFDETYPWLLEPLQDVLSEGGEQFLLKLGYAFPAIEIFMGIGLFFRKTRKAAIILAVIMHLLILLDMSPLGHNYNHVIWPWNIAMILFVILLFNDTAPFGSYKHSLRYPQVLVILLLFWIMPFLSFFNLWDSYLSASLYSGNTSSGVIYISDKVKEDLPQEIQQYVKGSHDQNQLAIKYWSMMELGVPGYPERRLFVNVKDYIEQYAGDPSEVFLIYTERISLIEPEKTEVIE